MQNEHRLIRAEASENKPSSWGETFLGLLPFLMFGVASLWLKSIDLFHLNEWRDTGINVMLLSYVAFAVLLGIGWAKGSPRWSFPYLGFVLFLSAFLTMATFPRLDFFSDVPNEHWGWRGWALPIAMAIVAFLATRSTRPLLQFIDGVWDDWTRLTFAMYGVLLLLAWGPVDEIQGLYPVFLLVTTTLILTVGAVAYMRGSSNQRRALALLIAIVMYAVVTTAGSAIYWDGRLGPWRQGEPEHWYNIVTQGAVGLAMRLALFFLPGVIGFARYADELGTPSTGRAQ